MSRLQDALNQRAAALPTERTPAEQAILDKFQERVGRLQSLVKNKDFAEYLKLEAEMNDPKIVIAHKCSDPICESLKAKIRDFWKRQLVLQKVTTNGAGARTQPRRAAH